MEINERILARHYRANEKAIKRSTRYYARKWRVSPDEISGDAREAFIAAVSNYVPSFGASVDTLIASYVKTALNHAAAKTKLLLNRYVPQSHMACVNSDGEKIVMELESVDFCTLQRNIEPSNSEEKELMELIDKNLDKNGKTLLQARLCGYTTADTIKAKLLTRHKAAKADIDLKAFALKEFPKCVK